MACAFLAKKSALAFGSVMALYSASTSFLAAVSSEPGMMAVAELEAAKVSASKEAAKIAASVGVEPVAQSPADQDKTAESVDHLATFLALPVGSKERSEYFAKHKTAIYNAAL